MQIKPNSKGPLWAALSYCAAVYLANMVTVVFFTFNRHLFLLQGQMDLYYQVMGDRDAWVNYLAFVLPGLFMLWYLWPLILAGWQDRSKGIKAQRRLLNAPLIVSLIGFSGWFTVLAVFIFSILWDSLSVGVGQLLVYLFDNLAGGLLCFILSYYMIELLNRRYILIKEFEAGGFLQVKGVVEMGLAHRFYVFYFAVAMFPMILLARLLYKVVLEPEQMPAFTEILPTLLFCWVLGLLLTMMMTSFFKIPINRLATAASLVGKGDLRQQLEVDSIDELGRLTQEFNKMALGLQERELIRDSFGRYVTPEVAQLVLQHRERLQGEMRMASILVTDIANYTTFSERMHPTEVVSLLNDYFSMVIEVIQKHKGTVNKFIGDSAFALFNVPLDDPDHAANAVRAALEIQELTESRPFGKGVMLQTRIGINSGEVVAGNLGGATRMEYTVIGDEVNVASRLEQLNKTYGTRLLVGENTQMLAKDSFDFELVEEVRLKGKREAVRVFRVRQP